MVVPNMPALVKCSGLIKRLLNPSVLMPILYVVMALTLLTQTRTDTALLKACNYLQLSFSPTFSLSVMATLCLCVNTHDCAMLQ